MFGKHVTIIFQLAELGEEDTYANAKFRPQWPARFKPSNTGGSLRYETKKRFKKPKNRKRPERAATVHRERNFDFHDNSWYPLASA